MQNEEVENNRNRSRIRTIGEAGLEPFIELLDEYQEPAIEITEALERGLREASRFLSSESDRPAKVMADQFRSGAEFIEQFRNHLQSSKRSDVIRFIETRGENHPEALFAASVLAGLTLGRLSRYAAQASETRQEPEEKRFDTPTKSPDSSKDQLAGVL